MDNNVIIKIPNGNSSVAGGAEENGNKLSVTRMVRLLRQRHSPGGRVGPQGRQEEEGSGGPAASDDTRPARFSVEFYVNNSTFSYQICQSGAKIHH